MNDHELQFKNVTFQYKNETNPIIKNLDLQINKGEFVSVIGPSGSGKSTLFKLVTGLEQQTSGSILLQNKSVSNRLGQVGYMP